MATHRPISTLASGQPPLKNLKPTCLGLAWLLAAGSVFSQPVTIAVIGASTAAGKNLPENGESLSDSRVNRYAAALTTLRPGSTVLNLAVAGYNTYHGLPTGSAVPAGRPAPDPLKNVTAALAANPAAIIANYVGDGGFGTDEAMANLTLIAAAANNAGVPIWVATTQPSIAGQTPAVIAQRQDQRDRIFAQFGSHAIDFWTPLADSDGSGLAARSLIQLYDDNHPNAEGHRLLFNQVVAANIVGNTPVLFGKTHSRLPDFSARFRPGPPPFHFLGQWRTLTGRKP